ncbi:hypothetical protein ACC692_37500, partial [Rhizobium ruizarguesonis]
NSLQIVHVSLSPHFLHIGVAIGWPPVTSRISVFSESLKCSDFLFAQFRTQNRNALLLELISSDQEVICHEPVFPDDGGDPVRLWLP